MELVTYQTESPEMMKRSFSEKKALKEQIMKK